MHDTEAVLAEQFDTPEQQEQAATAGMWMFLATEILFFGGLFMAYVVYRTTYPRDFAIASAHANVLLGTVNTAVLLTSSFFMAIAVNSVKAGKNKMLLISLAGTLILALTFLALKGLEYREHISDHLWPGAGFRKDLSPHVELFFWLYFVMTGLHAIHVFIGICILSVIAVLARKRKFSPSYCTPVEISSLYWHFVDIVWVFLYPLFYLIHR
jgi:cytochrome c oxidase subunit 3